MLEYSTTQKSTVYGCNLLYEKNTTNTIWWLSIRNSLIIFNPNAGVVQKI